MASAVGPSTPMNAKLAYVVLYVDDVDRSRKFYEDTFGLKVRREDASRRWAELETGDTTLAFTPRHQREADITGGVQAPDTPGEKPRPNIDISISVYDVSECLRRGTEAGGKVLAEAEAKAWGQTVGYLSDPDGVTIRVGSHIAHV